MRSPKAIAENIVSSMHKKKLDCATIPWHNFYNICDRERIKHEFICNVRKELRKRSFLIVEGNSVVVVMKDFNFSEI